MTAALTAAAHERSSDTRRRAVEALRELDAHGETVTFNSVAHAAGVSRSWLYRQPDLRAEVDRLRGRQPIPSTQRASTDSLRQRLDTTLAEIQRLKLENQQLRQQVAQRFGQHRADGTS